MGDLNERLARGDHAAFAELYDRCADRLHHYLVVSTGSRSDADDVMQETFVRLVRARRKLATVENLIAYVFAVARNEAVRSMSRRRSKVRSLEQLDACQVFCEAAVDDLVARETAETISTALARLPREQREVVELKTYGELTFAEIAEVTGAPAGTVATRYRAGVAHLRELLARTHCE